MKILDFKERIKITDQALKEHYRLTMERKRVSVDYLLMMTEGGDADAVALAIAQAQAKITRREFINFVNWLRREEAISPEDWDLHCEKRWRTITGGRDDSKW